MSDWHPKGRVAQSYDLWNEERGAAKRAVIVIDKKGIIQHFQVYPAGQLPEPAEILKVVENLP